MTTLEEITLPIDIVLKKNELLAEVEHIYPPKNKNLMQWVAVTMGEDDLPNYLHQYDMDDVDETTQRNIKKVLALEKDRKLVGLFLIPKKERLTDETIKTLNPIFWVSMLDGSLHINGQEYDLRPKEWQSLDPQPEYNFHYYRAVRESRVNNDAGNAGSAPPHLRLYRLGWYATHEGERVDRLIVLDVLTNIVEFRTKR